jgi:hypothetical protein
MPFLHFPVSQEQLDNLTEYAFSKRMPKVGVVRDWLDSLPGSTQATDASSDPATPAKAAATTADAHVLPQAQEEPPSIGFQPVAKREPNPAFAEQLRAKAALYRTN